MNDSSDIDFGHSYLDLPPTMFERVEPTPVRRPELLIWNAPLAEELGLAQLGDDPAAAAAVFGGNRVPPSSKPVALAYAGHQFGHFVPQLGDGRAHLLGEVFDREGGRRDIQLKGSGRTRFSRGGDGRCATGPALRELIMSEAMHALGVPTTRSLAVVATGEPVHRDRGPLPGAVVTRVAASHLRVGSLQYAAARGDLEALEALVRTAIARHYPELADDGAAGPEALLDRVITRQIELVVHWLRVGFIHGVMNTDNTALSGETIDYGPCAMIGRYSPATVFSSIDHGGRYAFGNQPAIAQWNLARLAECLMPLMPGEPKRATDRLLPLLESFPERFGTAYLRMMRCKLGLAGEQSDDEALVSSLLRTLEASELDYTVTFAQLPAALTSEQAATALRPALGDWIDRWRARHAREGTAEAEAVALMNATNPIVIPRNHHVEAVLERATADRDLSAAEELLAVLRSPYAAQPNTGAYQDPPADGDRSYRTFCGT